MLVSSRLECRDVVDKAGLLAKAIVLGKRKSFLWKVAFLSSVSKAGLKTDSQLVRSFDSSLCEISIGFWQFSAKSGAPTSIFVGEWKPQAEFDLSSRNSKPRSRWDFGLIHTQPTRIPILSTSRNVEIAFSSEFFPGSSPLQDFQSPKTLESSTRAVSQVAVLPPHWFNAIPAFICRLDGDLSTTSPSVRPLIDLRERKRRIS